jgi:hypothetical protein
MEPFILTPSLYARCCFVSQRSENFFEKDKAWVIAGDVGLPATNRFTGEPKRDEILNPHLDRHKERLAEQIVRDAVTPTQALPG